MSGKLREEGQVISLPDRRQLGYLSVGKGKPVFFFHGLPATRLMVLWLKEMAQSKQLQVIGVDRPGFGLSTFAPKRRLRDFADDVKVLADYLGFDTFGLMGISGGGPYVVTCAALLGDRVSHAIVVSGLALPLDTSDMSKELQMFYSMVTKPIVGKRLTKTALTKQAETLSKVATDPDAFLNSEEGKKHLKSVPANEAKLLTDPTFRPQLNVFARVQAEVVRRGNDSIEASIQEVKLFKEGWDVDLSKIRGEVVYILHGSADPNAPISNAQRNAKAIPGAQLEIVEGGGHFVLFNNLDRIGEILTS